MYDVFLETMRTLKRGEPCVLSTVIRTKGSTPQKPGAKLLVKLDGSGIGTLGGGCVEGDIWFAAKNLLIERGTSEVKDYYLNEELAEKDGLICGGTMYFLLDTVLKPNEFLPIAEEIVSAYENGSAVGLASIIKSPKGVETPVGTKLFIRADGTTTGTLNNSHLEEFAKNKALELMPFGRCEFVDFEGIELFIEGYTTPPQLVVLGGGHISKALSNLADTLSFSVHIIDDRPEFSNATRFPNAQTTIVDTYDKGLDRIPISRNTYIVIATRGHKYDDMATEAAARSQAGYIGLLGSRRKSLMIFEELFRKGIPEDRIRTIQAPVGLALGGRTPEEIAMSIMAEILMFHLGGNPKSMKMSNSLVEKAKRKSKDLSRTG